eukprot:369695_1
MAANNSKLTEQERHDIILETLSSIGKGPECFKQRWKEDSGDYLTGDILLNTPMFWFMRYKWSRNEIETLFYKAQVVIDERFDNGLKQTFGGNPGQRWKGGGGVRPCKPPKEDDGDSIIYSPNHPDFEYNPVIQPVDFEMKGNRKDKEKEKDDKGKNKGNYKYNRDHKPNDDDNGAKARKHGAKMNDFLDDINDGINDEDESDFETDSDNNEEENEENEQDNGLAHAFSMNALDGIRTAPNDSDKVAKSPKTKTPKVTRATTITTGRVCRTPTNQKLKRWAGTSKDIGNKSHSSHAKQRSARLQWEYEK